MIQLQILSGKQAGTHRVARRFPFRIGRSSAADLCLEEDGVWDQHLELDLITPDGFVLTAHPNALVVVNSQRIEQAVLRNGDLIEMGSLKMRFWLSETRQIGLRFREGLTWCALVLLAVGQVCLIYWLLR
ncbi:MAG: FHA domain-containing protein [Verrucomicrobia bacterium]|nr:FHA domain-containing protein [Verrucomicrobiota bacterium]